nr:hypothetical protein [Catenuloplanes japonicus]
MRDDARPRGDDQRAPPVERQQAVEDGRAGHVVQDHQPPPVTHLFLVQGREFVRFATVRRRDQPGEDRVDGTGPADRAEDLPVREVGGHLVGDAQRERGLADAVDALDQDDPEVDGGETPRSARSPRHGPRRAGA